MLYYTCINISGKGESLGAVTERGGELELQSVEVWVSRQLQAGSPVWGTGAAVVTRG